MGGLFAIVVWFMILQHVPRCALLALGTSKRVASMALWNAVFTVMGIVGGYALQGGSLAGAILGNALGKVAGCIVGWSAMRACGLRVGGVMTSHSLGFLALLGAGILASEELVHLGWLTPSVASLSATGLFGLPLAAWVWRSTISPLRADRGVAG